MQSNNQFPLVFERSKKGRIAYSLPVLDVPQVSVDEVVGSKFVRKNAPRLPELSELEVARHYTGLSNRNHGVDTGFYPLGSCTMKYNPKVNEVVAREAGFAHIHPYQNVETVQGAMELLYELQEDLKEITGMDEVTLQPAAGAHGEWTGLMLIRAYHEDRGDFGRRKVIVPDSAHGTNPASATVSGFDTVTVRSREDGLVDLEDLRRVVGPDTAALMLTNPNTIGLFESDILEMTKIVHDAGGKVYYDGANLNAVLSKARPGDMGFDVVHVNVHKTFSTPHGGGGPGAGPVGVKADLEPYLPIPVITKTDEGFRFDSSREKSIGRVKSYYGNFSILVRAYAYIRSLGAQGLKDVTEHAVLNANYMMSQLAPYYDVPFNRVCKHEFVLSGKRQKANGVRTLDIAKRLLDFKFHPPTIYFPLIVEECMMIEPTETESKETLDEFINVLIQIAKEAEETPDVVKNAPYNTVVTRLDETRAARTPVLKHQFE